MKEESGDWSKTMCKALLPEPEETIGPPRHRMEVRSLETIQTIASRDEVHAWIRNTLRLGAATLSRQLPACQCGLLS